MPIDASIPLQVKNLDTANPLLQFAQLQRQGKKDKIDEASNKLDTELKTQQLANAKFEAMGARDKARLTSTVLGAAQLDTHLQAGDIAGAQTFLENRRKELGQRIADGENVDTNETDQAIQLLKDGNIDELKNITKQATHLGQLTGILKTPKELNPNGDKPALLQTLDAYKNASPEDKAILRTFAKVDEKGTTIDPATGKIINAPGSLDATRNASGAKEEGKLQQQLIYEPTIEGNKAKAKSDKEFLAKAQQNLPTVIDNAEYLKTQLDTLVNHPGKKYAVGGTSVLPILPGTDAADFKARLEQVNGEQFLQAYNTLKGGGQITEIEGQKATDAIARMQRSQTEGEFDKSAKEFKDIVDKATKRARAAAGSNINEDVQTPAEKAASLLPEEKIQTGGSVLNSLPQGAKQIGTSGGKPVYQTPDGKKFVQE